MMCIKEYGGTSFRLNILVQEDVFWEMLENFDICNTALQGMFASL